VRLVTIAGRPHAALQPHTGGLLDHVGRLVSGGVEARGAAKGDRGAERVRPSADRRGGRARVGAGVGANKREVMTTEGLLHRVEVR
jgi:hypothetical protein